MCVCVCVCVCIMHALSIRYVCWQSSVSSMEATEHVFPLWLLQMLTYWSTLPYIPFQTLVIILIHVPTLASKPRIILTTIRQFTTALVLQKKNYPPGVSARESVGGAIVPVYLELLHSIHTLQGSKTSQRDFRGARHKLQEVGPIRLIKGTQSTPEPNNLQGESKKKEREGG